MNTQTGVEPSSGATAAAKGTPAGADQLARSGPAKAPLPSTLDFLSEDFDAAAALAIRPPLVPPDPEARPLDYVAKFRPLLPEEMPESLAGKQREVGSEATKLKHELLKEKAMRTFTRIEESCKVSLAGVMAHVPQDSPLAALARWHAAGERVRVVTRHSCGVRGVAEGRLVAYDCFMNLVLQDVLEKYTVLRKVPKTLAPKPAGPGHEGGSVQGPGQPAATGAAGAAAGGPVSGSQGQGQGQGQERIKWVRKQEHRQRQLGQVMIKGDNIVTVSCNPTSQSIGNACAAEAGGGPGSGNAGAGKAGSGSGARQGPRSGSGSKAGQGAEAGQGAGPGQERKQAPPRPG